MSRSTRVAAIVGTFALAAGTGCVSDKLHPYELHEGHLGAPGVERVLLLSPNALTELAPELDGSTRRVSKEIRAHLEACDVEVTAMSVADARQAWMGLETQAGESQEQRAGRFARLLIAAYDVDVMIAPDLAMRAGRVRAVTRDVDWDGVRRTLEVKGHIGEHGSVWVTTEVRGEMPAVSLHVAVYEPQGSVVFDSFGGLDLIHDAKLNPVTRQDLNQRVPIPTWNWELKRGRLRDAEHLREGVAMAFEPYLVRPPAPGTVAGEPR